MTALDLPGPNGGGNGTGVIAVAGEALVDLVPAPVGGYFEIAPGWVPERNASRIAPGASDGSTEPLP